ncbi:MAG: ABC transporter permease [Planctomycetota bacterium]
MSEQGANEKARDDRAERARQGEAYLDIVWRQFKKNRPAYYSLWLLLPIFLIAIFAPLLASDQPLVYRTPKETIYPWLRALFNPTESVDFVFNMALLGFVPWLLLTLIWNWSAKRRQVPGRTRVLTSVVHFVVVLLLFVGIFSFSSMRPTNQYRARTFVQEQFESKGQETGVYPLIAFGPTEQDLTARDIPPLSRKPQANWADSNDDDVHWMGTDGTGRDVLVQMIYGTRISMTVGFVAVGLYLTIGVLVGAVAGYFGGKIDMITSRVIEVVLLFPSFFLILTLVAMIGPSIYIIMVVIGFTSWPTIARLIRGEVLKQRAIDYVAAARAVGASHSRIIFRHILPNAISPALVAAPFGVAGAIITEAGLSLLGFGVRPPTPSWGTLLRQGNENYTYWWLIVIPSLAIFLTVTVFNLVGSGLRDAMDPRLRS